MDEKEEKRLIEINDRRHKPFSTKHIQQLARKHSTRLVSLQNDHAGDWLHVAPTSRELVMQSEHMTLAVKHRLGLTAFDDLSGDVCACGVALNVDSDHFHNCNKNTKIGANKRHNWWASVLCKTARTLECPVEGEPDYKQNVNIDMHGRIRPDLLELVTHPNTHDIACIDVSVVHSANATSLASSHCNKTSCPRLSLLVSTVLLSVLLLQLLIMLLHPLHLSFARLPSSLPLFLSLPLLLLLLFHFRCCLPLLLH